MKLADLLPASHVVTLSATDMSGIIAELARAAAVLSGGKLDPVTLERRLMDRERERSTGLGHAVAVPHAKAPEIDAILCVAGISPAGIDCGAPDGAACRIFFCLVAPESQPAAHLKALAIVSRVTRTDEVRARLISARDADEFAAVIRAAEG